MRKQLSPLQAKVLRLANAGWTLIARGDVVYANDERIATRATVDNLTHRGLLWRFDSVTWVAVKTDRQRGVEAESEISALADEKTAQSARIEAKRTI